MCFLVQNSKSYDPGLTTYAQPRCSILPWVSHLGTWCNALWCTPHPGCVQGSSTAYQHRYSVCCLAGCIRRHTTQAHFIPFAPALLPLPLLSPTFNKLIEAPCRPPVHLLPRVGQWAPKCCILHQYNSIMSLSINLSRLRPALGILCIHDRVVPDDISPHHLPIAALLDMVLAQSTCYEQHAACMPSRQALSTPSKSLSSRLQPPVTAIN